MASSVFVRHTLNALYANPHVELRRVDVQTPLSKTHAHREISKAENRAGTQRDKSVFIGLCVRGIARVSRAPAEWEV